MPETPAERLARHMLAMLHRKFPKAFKGRGDNRMPLKTGIHRDLHLELPAWPRPYIAIALQSYTHSRRYLEACVAGAERIDLRGRVSGYVSEPGAERAESHIVNTPAARKRPQQRNGGRYA